MWALYKQINLFSKCFQRAWKLRIKYCFCPPLKKPTNSFPSSTPVVENLTHSGLHLLCQQMWRCPEVPQMFVLLSLVGAPGRGGKMIPEFQRSLLDWNNENCPHVEKNLDLWLLASLAIRPRRANRLEFHFYLKIKKIIIIKERKQKKKAKKGVPAWERNNYVLSLQATTINKFKHKMEEILTWTKGDQVWIVTYTDTHFWKQT